MENERNKKTKVHPVRKAGEALPRQRHQRHGKAPQAQTRNAGAHGAIPAVRPEPLKPEVRPSARVPGAAQELFEPQEWDALLAGLDHEHISRAPSAPHVAADDLWERLSKARWLPKNPRVVKAEGRAVQRPSA